MNIIISLTLVCAFVNLGNTALPGVRESCAAAVRNQSAHTERHIIEIHKQMEQAIENAVEKIDLRLERKIQIIHSSFTEKLKNITNYILGKSGESPKLPDFYHKSRDCTDHYESGRRNSGVYSIYVQGLSSPQKVWCVSGWTTIQRRNTGLLSFERNWADYTKGFGALDKEFWMGLDLMYFLTRSGRYKLNIEVVPDDSYGTDSKIKFVEVLNFSVGEPDGYQLQLLDKVTSNMPGMDNTIAYHNGKRFSTYDRDQGSYADNCAARSGAGGFWYSECAHLHLNSKLLSNSCTNGNRVCTRIYATKWLYFKSTELKIRPKQDPDF